MASLIKYKTKVSVYKQGNCIDKTREAIIFDI